MCTFFVFKLFVVVVCCASLAWASVFYLRGRLCFIGVGFCVLFTWASVLLYLRGLLCFIYVTLCSLFADPAVQ